MQEHVPQPSEGIPHGMPERGEQPRGLQKLSDIPGWRITEGPDIRGWSVVDRNGDSFGEVTDLIVEMETGDVEYAVVGYGGVMGAGGDKTAIPTDELDINEEEKHVKVHRSQEDLKNAPKYEDDTRDFDQFRNYWHGRGTAPTPERGTERGVQEGQRMVIPEVEEHLVSGKRREQVGEVEIHKETETHPETVHETLRKTRVRVSRHPVEHREVKEGEPMLKEGETVSIPVVEERLVVGKRAEVTGEVVVEPESFEEEARETQDVRKEHVEIEKHGEAEIEEQDRPGKR